MASGPGSAGSTLSRICTAGTVLSAHALLQAYADHATPFGTWVEEQQPKAIGTRTSGDMSDAEASAFFVQAVRSFMVRERGTTLHLLDGIPPRGWSPVHGRA